MIDKELREILVCPECKGDLDFNQREITCLACDSCYQTHTGIPVMLTHPSNKKWKTLYEKSALEKKDTPLACGHTNRSYWSLRNIILDGIGDVQNRKILDAGCGPGLFSKHFVSNNSVIGVDFSYNMLVLAREKGIHCVQADLLKLPLRTNSFDFIFCIETVQYFEDCGQLVTELSEALKKEGKLVLSFLNAESVARNVYRNTVGILRSSDIKPKWYRINELKCAFLSNELSVEEILATYYPLKGYKVCQKPNLIDEYLVSNFVIRGVK